MEKVVVMASNQPPLCFYGSKIFHQFFEDADCPEPYLALTAYLVHEIGPLDDRPSGVPDQEQCVVILKESQWNFEYDKYGEPLGADFCNKKYLILKHPNTSAHIELFEFCLQRENNVKTISGDFLNFLKEVGKRLTGDETFYFFKSPWEVAR